MSTSTAMTTPVRTQSIPAQERRSLLTCQAFAGTLIIPCPNLAAVPHSRHGDQRMVCRGHQG